MNRLNFKSFDMFTDISGKNRQTVDVRESFANILYTKANGIKMHALAMKIYKSDGIVEYNDDEVRIIKEMADGYTIPAFIDTLNEQINGNNDIKQ